VDINLKKNKMNFIEEKIINKGNNNSNLRLRFPPEPNGESLHIGHAKSICLNFGLAEKYAGTCNLRFDDTNPITEKKEFVDSIIKNIEWLGFKPTNIFYTSEYFGFLYDCAVILIKKGLAYVDDSTSEEIAALKGTTTLPGKSSPYYSRTVEENLDLFEKMKNGEFAEGSKILRAKIDMASPNMILRDPVIYRIINKTHHHVGDDWKIYPMYDFAHPLSDYIEGITDSLCTLEFEVHRPLYNWVLNNLDLKNELPEETEFSRLNIDYTVMSKRKLKRLVDEGFVSGWDDPRMPTISGLRRRGYTPESIKNFCEIIGVTRFNSVISHNLLEECLRIDLNKKANRLMGVIDPVKITITNWNNETEMIEVENNPEDESAGKRLIPFTGEIWIEREDFREEADNKFFRLKTGGEVRLKGAYVIKANEIIKDGDEIIEIKCTYDPLTKSGMPIERKIKGTIHWVSVEYGINVEVREYGKLFSDATPDNYEDDFVNYLAKDSLIINNKAVFEPAVIDCIPGVPVQMVRKGYYVRDLGTEKVVFNKTVSLKEDKNRNIA
jgi:glutaminyl-tRNA synthetase